MNYSVPSTLIVDRDSENQFSEYMMPRNTQFVIPDSDITVTSGGAVVNFTMSDYNGFYNFRDSCLVFKLNYTSPTTVTDYDMSKIIDMITVTQQGQTLVAIHNAWAIDQVMQRFRGTEENDLDNGTNLVGNASLYRGTTSINAVARSHYIAIPMSRFGDFWLNEKKLNDANLQISIRLAALSNAFITPANAEDVTISECRFTMCKQILDSVVRDAFLSQISDEAPMKQNMTSYIVRNFGATGGVSVINDAPQVTSLDRVHGFITNGTTRTVVPITALSALNIAINGKALKTDGINSTNELGMMTMESGNMTSNQFSGMSQSWMNAWSQEDGVPHLETFSVQTAFEPDEAVKGGINTMNRQKLTGDIRFTAAGDQLWIVSEYTGSLVTTPNNCIWQS